jgi:hypothetical protein
MHISPETAELIIQLGATISEIGRSLLDESPAVRAADATREDIDGIATEAGQNANQTAESPSWASSVPNEDAAVAVESADEAEPELGGLAISSALNPSADFFNPRLQQRQTWAPSHALPGTADELRELSKSVICNILAVAGPEEGGRCVTRSLWRFRATKLSDIPDHMMQEAARSLVYGCNECRMLRALAPKDAA